MVERDGELKMNRLRVLLNTNIYGFVIEYDLDLIEKITTCNRLAIYGNTVIRNELRDTPKDKKTEAKRSYRILLLNNFDLLVGKHVIQITKETEKLARAYFREFKRNKGIQRWQKIKNDFIIVASATLKNLDVVASEDNKTMLSKKATDSYQIVNGKHFLRTPTFISYENFKKIVRSCGT